MMIRPLHEQTVDKEMAKDVSAMFLDTMAPMLDAEPASVIAGTLAFLATVAKRMTNGDDEAAVRLLGAWGQSAQEMARRISNDRDPHPGENIVFGGAS